MRDTITCIDYCTRQVATFHFFQIRVWSSQLRKQSERSLNTNEQTLHVKRLEHDFRDLFSVFRRVHRWLSENEPVLLGFTTQIGVDRLVPVALDAFPIRNLAVPQNVADFMRLTARQSFIADVEIHFLVKKAL